MLAWTNTGEMAHEHMLTNMILTTKVEAAQGLEGQCYSCHGIVRLRKGHVEGWCRGGGHRGLGSTWMSHRLVQQNAVQHVEEPLWGGCEM